MFAAVDRGHGPSSALDCMAWPAAACIGALAGLLLGALVGAALPHPHPLDRPSPRLAALATCQEPL